MDDPILSDRLDVLVRNLSWMNKPASFRAKFENVQLPDDRAWDVLNVSLGGWAMELIDKIAAARKLDDEEAWTRYAEISGQSELLFQEALELLGGLALRHVGLEAEIWQVADHIINECSKAALQNPALTVPTSQEVHSQTIGRIIRLRYPETTIWSVPFTAYEFGRVVIAKAMPRFGDDLKHHLAPEEHALLPVLIAEVFATFVMGPAYACAAIHLRLDPSKAYCSRTTVRGPTYVPG